MRVNLSSLDLVVFVAYLVAIGALATWASRAKNRTRRDYFLGGDKLPWWMVGGSIVAANISSHQFIGVMGVAYKRGFVAVTSDWNAILIGFNALLWIFLPFYLRNGFYTMPEFLQRRYGAATRSLFAGLILLIYVFVEIGAVLYFGALALNALLGISIAWCIPAIAFVTAIYTIAGGLRAVVWTEMLQLVVLIGGGERPKPARSPPVYSPSCSPLSSSYSIRRCPSTTAPASFSGAALSPASPSACARVIPRLMHSRG